MSAVGSDIGRETSYSIVADTDGGGNIRISPQTALCEVDPFLLKILEFLWTVSLDHARYGWVMSYITSSLPFLVPASRGFFEDFHGSFVFIAA